MPERLRVGLQLGGGRKFGMEFNFVLFQSYKSYEIKFLKKISSFTVSSSYRVYVRRKVKCCRPKAILHSLTSSRKPKSWQIKKEHCYFLKKVSVLGEMENKTLRSLYMIWCFIYLSNKLEAQWPIGYGVGLRIKRSSVRIRPRPLRWVLGQGSLLPLSQGEAFTLASVSYLAILVKYMLAKKVNSKSTSQAVVILLACLSLSLSLVPHCSRFSYFFFFFFFLSKGRRCYGWDAERI